MIISDSKDTLALYTSNHSRVGPWQLTDRKSVSCKFVVGEWFMKLSLVRQYSVALCIGFIIIKDIISVKNKKIKNKKHPVRCHCCTYIFILNTCGVDKNNKSQPWHSTGNAGFRLHFPAHFELVGDQEARHQESEGEQNRMEQLPRQQPVARSVEACIGQKLQLIGDQFHREHLQLVRSNYASCWLYKLFAL